MNLIEIDYIDEQSCKDYISESRESVSKISLILVEVRERQEGIFRGKAESRVKELANEVLAMIDDNHKKYRPEFDR